MSEHPTFVTCAGPTATKAIREMGYKGAIIGVTGNVLSSDMSNFLAHGADKVLSKPVGIDTSESTITGNK